MGNSRIKFGPVDYVQRSRTLQRDKGGAPRNDRPLFGSNRTGLWATSKQDNTLNKRKAKEAPKSTPEYKLSKASKDEDLSRWEKMHTLRKKKEEEVDKEEENIEIPQRVGKQWDVLDIDIQFKGSDTGCGGHGRGCGSFKDNQDRPPIVQPWEREYVSSSSSISPKESRHKTSERDVVFRVHDPRGNLKLVQAGSSRGHCGP
ncbi:hypothetical protein GE061_001665 [Apolygus lucorum]|uniref:Hyaluronan/mRNA-binding protein domain-containing protein n=1 Tax=Apolygus lucorum TaxID=248454 RepID=A0A8S9YAU7_APOLU|nr:hypothetical protein GE061_001665 [Apolygus lucorum]